MAETTAPSPRALRRRWAPAEKRRIVELTLHAGASVAAIAREHGVNRSNLRQWQSLYRAGKLDLQGQSASAVAGRDSERDVCAGERGSPRAPVTDSGAL